MHRFCLRYQAIDLNIGDAGLVAGRVPECDLVLDDALVSRKHASFRVVGDAVEVCDLGSRNGVLVNGERLDGKALLRHGDNIRIGAQELVLKDTSRSHGSAGTRELVRCTQCGEMGATATFVCKRCGQPFEQIALASKIQRTLSSEAAPKRPPSSLSVLAQLADKALGMQRYEEAERLLAGPLNAIRERATAGACETETLESATRYALRLGDALQRSIWIDYAFELYAAATAIMSAELIDELYRVAAKVRYSNSRPIHHYLARLRQNAAGGFGANERFLLQRLEGLQRRILSG